MRNLLLPAAAAGCFALLTPAVASAASISLTTLLSGDPRLENPDGLKVQVTVDQIASDTTRWTVDLLMDDVDPNARLDEFGFNLLGGPGVQYTISEISPVYAAAIKDKLAGYGGGTTTFFFTLDDPAGNPNDATNLTSLSFLLKKSTAFTENDFLNAPDTCASNVLGCNQLAAHIVGLNDDGSGVAVGDYANDPPDLTPVPEPSSLLLLGSGAVAAAVARRRRKSEERKR